MSNPLTGRHTATDKELIDALQYQSDERMKLVNLYQDEIVRLNKRVEQLATMLVEEREANK